MCKATKALHALSKQPFRLPKSAADLIPIDEVWEDGIFRSGKVRHSFAHLRRVF